MKRQARGKEKVQEKHGGWTTVVNRRRKRLVSVRPLPFDKVEESEAEDDDEEMDEDDVEGVSDTWENAKEIDPELEDGEIPGESPIAGGDTQNDGEVPGEIPIAGGDTHSDGVERNMERRGLNEREVETLHGVTPPLETEVNGEKPNPINISPGHANVVGSPKIASESTRVIESGVKRRRVDSSVFCSIPCRTLFVEEEQPDGDGRRDNVGGSAPMDLIPHATSEARNMDI
ncbi:hypothetical protein L1887_01193 [Cichorium endivia]|nr:hypothetical protein L1887_01193 [Cichorium endivia]